MTGIEITILTGLLFIIVIMLGMIIHFYKEKIRGNRLNPHCSTNIVYHSRIKKPKDIVHGY